VIFPKFLKKEKSFAFLKLVSPFAGIVEIDQEQESLVIKNKDKKILTTYHRWGNGHTRRFLSF
jgi:hypothetical protein